MPGATVTGPPLPQWRPPRRTAGAGGAGTPGPPGPAGPAGPGVPAGGTAGQVLEKATGADFDTVWATLAAGGSRVTIQPSPPASPAVGDLWWRNNPDGVLFVYYNDGNSTQWVPATPTTSGPPGPAGPAGDAGTVAYRHVQASAAATWTIAHGLAFRPNVTAVDSTGHEITPGDVTYPDSVTVQLSFSAAVGGEAYLS